MAYHTPLQMTINGCLWNMTLSRGAVFFFQICPKGGLPGEGGGGGGGGGGGVSITACPRVLAGIT